MQNCNARKAVVLLQQTGPAVWLEFDFEKDGTSEPELVTIKLTPHRCLKVRLTINHPYLLSHINTCINNKKKSAVYTL